MMVPSHKYRINFLMFPFISDQHPTNIDQQMMINVKYPHGKIMNHDG